MPVRLWTRWHCIVILAAFPATTSTSAEPPTLGQEVEGLLHVVSLTGSRRQRYAISANDS